MTGPDVTLESLEFDWGDAYLFSYARDRWVALRRDRLRYVTAETLEELEHAIDADHRGQPVPREFGPPGAADYLDLPDDDVPDEESRIFLAAIRSAFPLWTITYSEELRVWMARTRRTTVCQASPVLLCASLLLIQRRQPPGWPGPVSRGLPGGDA